jgi:hypothetical protein
MHRMPDKLEVLKRLTPIYRPLYRAMEGALQQTREFFDLQQTSVCPSLAPNLVRFFAKKTLSHRFGVEYEEDVDYSLKWLPNNGLCLHFDQHDLRILKSDDGEVPVPGQSTARQEFWTQTAFAYTYGEENLPYSDSESIGDPHNTLRLIILWEVDGNYNLKKLVVACPKTGGETRESVSIWWMEEIPHPGEGGSFSGDPIPTAGDGPDDLDFDINGLAKGENDKP